MIFDLLEKDKPSRQICQMPCDQFSWKHFMLRFILFSPFRAHL
jgi:hypothetical protein